MLYEETTAIDAVKHFAKHIFPSLFVGQRNKDNKEYHRVFRIIQDAERGKVSETRARDILWKYGGLSYRITNSFEVAVTEGNVQTFAELAAEFREKHPNAFGLPEDENETKPATI